MKGQRIKKLLIAAYVISPLVIFGAVVVLAAYTGPNRNTISGQTDRCQYHASYDLGSGNFGGCDLTLWANPDNGCDSAGSVHGYFNPVSCVGWPSSCDALGCSVSGPNVTTLGCTPSSSNPNCKQITVSQPPATVSGSTSCASPGANGWCRGGGVLNLSANEPVSGWTITGIESDLEGMLCTGNSPSLSCSWPFPEGQTSLNFWADSSHGDTSYQSSASMKLDSVAPSVSITQSGGTLGNAGWYVSAVPFTASASDPAPSSGIASTQYVVDGGAPQAGASVSIGADGSHTVYFVTTDNAGNVSAPSATLSVKIDRTPPAISTSITGGTSGLNGWYTSAVQVGATASDATSGVDPAGLQYTVDGGAPQSGSTATVAGDGTHTVVFSAHDIAGNQGSGSQTVRIDTTPPVAGFSIPAPDGQNGWYRSAVTVSATASDATSGVASREVSQDNATWSPSVTISTDGVYTVYSRATDNAGNTSSNATMTVSLDTTPPTVSLVLPPTTSGWYNTQPAISPTASDATSGVASIEYSLDGGPFQSPLATMSDGAHSFTVRVTDKAGNSVTSAPYNVKVDTTSPVSVFVSPPEGSTVVAAGNFTMSGTTSDATSGVAGAQISVDNGSTWSPLTVSNGSWSFLWDTGKVANGTYQVYVRGMDVAGNIEHTAHITVTVANQGPGVSITKSWVIWQTAMIKVTTHILPIAGGQITISHLNGYDVQSFDYTGMVPANFKWNGITSKGTSAPAGLYTVKVEIWDAYGQHAHDSGVLWIPAPLPTSTETPTSTATPVSTQVSTQIEEHTATPEIHYTPMPTGTATRQAIVPVAPNTGASKPSLALNAFLEPRFLFPTIGMVSLFCALAVAGITDKRPRAIRQLATALKKYGQESNRLNNIKK